MTIIEEDSSMTTTMTIIRDIVWELFQYAWQVEIYGRDRVFATSMSLSTNISNTMSSSVNSKTLSSSTVINTVSQSDDDKDTTSSTMWLPLLQSDQQSTGGLAPGLALVRVWLDAVMMMVFGRDSEDVVMGWIETVKS